MLLMPVYLFIRFFILQFVVACLLFYLLSFYCTVACLLVYPLFVYCTVIDAFLYCFLLLPIYLFIPFFTLHCCCCLLTCLSSFFYTAMLLLPTCLSPFFYTALLLQLVYLFILFLYCIVVVACLLVYPLSFILHCRCRLFTCLSPFLYCTVVVACLLVYPLFCTAIVAIFLFIR